MNHLILLPFITPMIMALIFLFLPKNSKLKDTLSLISFLALMIPAGLLLKHTATIGNLYYQVANWPAPYGIVLQADFFSTMMLFISLFVGFFSSLFAMGSMSAEEKNPYFHSLFQLLFCGINGSFITGDLFNLYVCFEIILISSFCLLAYGNEGKRLLHASKYVVMNLIASTLFLIAAGLIYGQMGTLNFAHLGQRFSELNTPTTFMLGSLILIAFGIKSALFPMYHWLPLAYPVAKIPILAVFAGMLTKVGLYAMIRFATTCFGTQMSQIQYVLLFVAGMTMITGVMGAAGQTRTRSILSYHIISQVGYMALGLAVYTVAGISGTLFYLLHHILAKTNLFFISGYIEKKFGTDNLKEVGGLLKMSPWIAFSFIPPAFALAGLPPFSGFFAKLMVIKSAVEIEAYIAAFAAVLTGIMTLYSMTKIWNEAFLKDNPSPEQKLNPVPISMSLPILVFSLCTILLGVLYPWIHEYFDIAAQSLMSSTHWSDLNF